MHGEAVFGTDGGDVTEFVTRGRQTTRGSTLYLIIRFWDGQPSLRLADLESTVHSVTLITTGQDLPSDQDGAVLTVHGLPLEAPTRLFPVIRIECDAPPRSNQWGRDRLWSGDPSRVADWARPAAPPSGSTAANADLGRGHRPTGASGTSTRRRSRRR